MLRIGILSLVSLAMIFMVLAGAGRRWFASVTDAISSYNDTRHPLLPGGRYPSMPAARPHATAKAVQHMETLKIRRLPVINKSKRMVGILSLGDVSHSAPGDLLS